MNEHIFNLNPPMDPQQYAPILTPELETILKVGSMVTNDHVLELSKMSPLSIPKESLPLEADTCSLFQIDHLGFDKEESIIKKMGSVFSAAAAMDSTVVMVIKPKNALEEGVDLYFGVSGYQSRTEARDKAKGLYRSFVGNFPGCRTDREDGPLLNSTEIKGLINRCFSEEYQAVAAVSGVASARTEQEQSNDANIQSIDKVIESLAGTDYAMVLIARPISQENVDAMRSELEMLYTQLVPFAKCQFSLSKNETKTISETLTEGLSKMTGNNNSVNISVSASSSDSISDNVTKTNGVNVGVNAGYGMRMAPRVNVGGHLGFHHSKAKTHGTGHADSEQKGVTLIRSMTESFQTQEGTAKSHGTALLEGQSTQLDFENHQVSRILENITQKIKRLDQGAGMGLFSVAAYITAPTETEAVSAGSLYKSIIMGNDSFVERSAVNVWGGKDCREVCSYLRYFIHPEFRFDEMTVATPASVVNSEELALHMSLPKASVTGITVTKSVSFGRNIVYQNRAAASGKKLHLGRLYHLSHDEDASAELDLASLNAHTLIAGTTRTGKSNTIYQILNSLRKKEPRIHFLVIEPAKGDYKKVYAGDPSVHVYGTNPNISPLLVLNPFSFDQASCHVLEHIDRLVGIFTVCWPMEAAMPSILKQAILAAYENAGWDLRRSINRLDNELFPSIDDVMQEIEDMMNKSNYSDENKGNYIGALNTRLAELTKGLYGMIFSGNEIPEKHLFDENAIIDLSRVSNSETRSLMMGLLIIKLQEYRERSYNGHDKSLQHITVLEEAHNILRAVPAASSNAASVTGKSVQMLSDAMAQMGAYGEGFLIADQSVAELDSSVLRNTNTKIVLNLPFEEDRRPIGRSMGMRDVQIEEIASLPMGVAAVYQKGWREPVLVHVDRVEMAKQPYTYELTNDIYQEKEKESLLDCLSHLDIDSWLNQYGLEDTEQPDGLKLRSIVKSNLSTPVKCGLLEYVKDRESGGERLWSIAKIAYYFFNTHEALTAAMGSMDEAEWYQTVLRELRPSLPEDIAETDAEILLRLLVREQSLRDPKFRELHLKLNGSL